MQCVTFDAHWASLTERDSIIFRDNDFEVFIDPNGDGALYFELEINALGTEWDLLLVKAYRDGGPALHGFDMPGLKSAVHLDGTLNDRSDRDKGWTLEIAIPWSALAPFAGTAAPPREGDVWWLNHSRVEHALDPAPEGPGYVKRKGAAGRELPESNWVWSPQGVIAMHEPESWGLVQFTRTLATEADPAKRPSFTPPADFAARQALWDVYRRQRAFRAKRGRYTDRVEELGIPVKPDSRLALALTPSGFEATFLWKVEPQGKSRKEHRLWIRADGSFGRVVRTVSPDEPEQ